MWNLCPSVLWIRQQDVCGTCDPVWQHTAQFRRTRPSLLLKCAATEDRNMRCFLLYVSAFLSVFTPVHISFSLISRCQRVTYIQDM